MSPTFPCVRGNISRPTSNSIPFARSRIVVSVKCGAVEGVGGGTDSVENILFYQNSVWNQRYIFSAYNYVLGSHMNRDDFYAAPKLLLNAYSLKYCARVKNLGVTIDKEAAAGLTVMDIFNWQT